MKIRHHRFSLIFILLIAAMLACNFTPANDSDDRSATVAALSTSVAATTTAINQEDIPSPTPEQAIAPTIPAQPTEDLAATQAAAQALAETQAAGEALAATQAALGPLMAELERYGVDPQRGQLAWVQGPLRFEIDQYMGSKFGNEIPQVIVQDFVLSADIRWDTKYGAAGCAFVFRSDGNQAKPNQYMVWMTRLTNGRVEFIIFAEGQIVGGKDFYANGIDPDFDGSNGATNRLAVVGRGKQFSVYTNGERLGVADPNAPIPPLVLPEPPQGNPADPVYQRAMTEYRATIARLKNEYNQRVALARRANKDFPAGIVAMGAFAESGYTMCEFNNAWLFLIAP